MNYRIQVGRVARGACVCASIQNQSTHPSRSTEVELIAGEHARRCSVCCRSEPEPYCLGHPGALLGGPGATADRRLGI